MDKKALMEYALFARKELETQIALSLNKLGIYKDRIAKCNIVGERTVVEGVSETFPKNVYQLRERIVSEHVRIDGFPVVVEEFAFTWFNRIIALRFMEVHDYFSHGFRVLTSRSGGYEPEIIRNLSYAADDLGLDMAKVDSLKAAGEDEELYRYVLFSQCNALSETLPMLFDKQHGYMELLLPHNLLSQNSVIRRITDIPESDFLNDVEVIGWLYQFYNSVKKDEVFASKKTITKETLPAVTQLFTPDWIVRYMAQNSVGRLWLESYPDSSLKGKMKYYVEDAEQEPNVLAKLERIKYRDVSPEEIRIIEPCCGSGHILVYVFDLLYEMYMERGYNRRDIPSLILKKNLYGLDVDKRAAQLSQFSLMMKARSIDPRFFNPDRIVIPNVYEILDSKPFGRFNYRDEIKGFKFSEYTEDVLNYLITTFSDGKVIGSLLKVLDKDYERARLEIHDKITSFIADTTQLDFQDHMLPLAEKLCKIASVLAKKYDVMITNPPYIGISSLEQPAKDYAKKYYPNSKADMFAMFMEVEFARKNGFVAMVNMHNWMFISSYESLRKTLVSNKLFVSMIHLGQRGFDSITGEIVQTTSFVMRITSLQAFKGSYYRLVNGGSEREKESLFSSLECRHFVPQTIFNEIPGTRFIYWANDTIRKSFTFPQLGDTVIPRHGLATSDNDRFLKLWHEVDVHKASLRNRCEFDKKWFPMNKGGTFRKWYGNLEWVINYENDGKEIKEYAIELYKCSSRTIQNTQFYFKEGITWSALTSGALSFRWTDRGTIFGSGAHCAFVDDKKKLYYALALMNGKISAVYTKMMSATMNINVEDIRATPMLIQDEEHVFALVNSCIENAKKDWDSFEVSWDFARHPLNPSLFDSASDDCIHRSLSLDVLFSDWSSECVKRFQSQKEQEEELNRHFINIYGLAEQVSPQVEDEDITIRLADKSRDIRSLISYFIGLLMGRYSLEQEGLVYAGGEFDFSKYGDYVDQDGVLHIYRFVGMNDGLTQSIVDMVTRIYGENTLEENLSFIANALDPKSSKSSRQVINDYLNDGFYADHLKIYQKRPIYWMMSSGKHGAFRCLLYMHRYNKNTLALINSKYFLPRTAMYKAERERLQARIDSGHLDVRDLRDVRKQLDEVIACQQELLEYGQVLDHMANQYIDIDLDDGVKVNYAKFQGIELEVDGRTVKKDLFVPIK